MEIRAYDAALAFQGVAEDQTSVTWNRKYYEPGDFQIVLPASRQNLSLFPMGNVVTFRGAQEAGVVEDVQIDEEPGSRTLTVSGRFLSSYMDRRLITGTRNFSGKTEEAMRAILSEAAAIPLVELGELQGFEETVTFQVTYKNLLAYEEKLGRSAGIGFRFRPDFAARKIYFECYKGEDRSRGQTRNPFVEFSSRFDNLNRTSYRANTQILKNVAYVGGEGEGSERVFVTVGDIASSGLERRELFVDARDLRSDDLTGAEYRAALAERGQQKLAEAAAAEAFECSTVPDGNFIYRRDYDLGDIVTVRKDEWGIQISKRITEITEVYEHEKASIVPTLGDALPSKFEQED